MEHTLEHITIRPFAAGDEPLVREFFAQMGEESTHFFNVNHGNERRTLGYFTGETKDHFFWMATANENGREIMVGLLFLWDISRKVPWLGIAVHEMWKGRHLGRLLIAEAKRYAEAHGCGGILLTTAQDNLRGQGLYERCGFERLGVHKSGEYQYIFRF